MTSRRTGSLPFKLAGVLFIFISLERFTNYVFSDKLTLAQRDRATQVRNRVFGDTGNFVSFPAAEDDISSPHTVPKKKCKSTPHQKGLLFEQSPRSFSLGNAPRCYSLSVTVQGQKALHAPALGNKIVDGIELDDDLALRRDLIEVCCSSRCVTFNSLHL